MALYKNCRELLYHNFNEIQLTGDLTYLVKDGVTHDEEELKEHWINILEEYLMLTNSFEQKKFFRDKAELKYLELKLTILLHLKPLIGMEMSKENKIEIESILKQYRVTDIDQDILATKDDINIKVSRFKNAYKEDDKQKATFEDIISTFRINGVSINRMETTVSEYVSLLKQYKNKNKK